MSRLVLTAVALTSLLLVPFVLLAGSPQEAPVAVQAEEGSVAAAPNAAAVVDLERTSCVACHGDAELFEEDDLAIVSGVGNDVHASLGLSCHDCHGGNPDPELFEDFGEAMDEAWGENPYRGAPTASDVPAMCGRCHSDASVMRRYNPAARVDQELEYRSSHHGQGLAAGNDRVATCTSCHGVHGIRAIADPASPVYATRVALTCASCHGDAEHMAGSTLADGTPMPVDQFERWSVSVHAEAMFAREDLSAPTCNDCHGNHGAAPPGLDSVNLVCGQCHGREAEIFRRSVKPAKFLSHNEYLADAEGEGCAACHEAPEPQAELTHMPFFGECSVCHGNHGVIRPSVALLSPLPETPCVFCHEGTSGPVLEVHDAPGAASHYEQELGRLLGEAAGLDLDAEALFDWLVDEAQLLPHHTTAGNAAAGTGLVRRPEFDRLFTKFRIGRTSYSHTDPRTGEVTRTSIVRCERCHASSEVIGEDAAGLTMAAEMLDRMRELTTRTAEAERVLLAARRGGVETRDALVQIDQAVDARIGLDVLLHSFSVEGEFSDAYEEGIARADEAMVAGLAALDELAARRNGLALSLLVILVVLVALGLKIRELSARQRAVEAGESVEE